MFAMNGTEMSQQSCDSLNIAHPAPGTHLINSSHREAPQWFCAAAPCIPPAVTAILTHHPCHGDAGHGTAISVTLKPPVPWGHIHSQYSLHILSSAPSYVLFIPPFHSVYFLLISFFMWLESNRYNDRLFQEIRKRNCMSSAAALVIITAKAITRETISVIMIRVKIIVPPRAPWCCHSSGLRHSGWRLAQPVNTGASPPFYKAFAIVVPRLGHNPPCSAFILRRERQSSSWGI